MLLCLGRGLPWRADSGTLLDLLITPRFIRSFNAFALGEAALAADQGRRRYVGSASASRYRLNDL